MGKQYNQRVVYETNGWDRKKIMFQMAHGLLKQQIARNYFVF